jgi:nicotinate-nucleotide adenylyltransferase
VSPQNPLKSRNITAAYEVRVESARTITQHQPRVYISTIEQERGWRYTIDTVEGLKQHHPRTQFVWLMGADNLAQFHRFRQWQQIARTIPIAVCDRAPFTFASLGSPFATRFAQLRLAERDAAQLSECDAPRWVYLHMPRHPLSSTLLRSTS